MSKLFKLFVASAICLLFVFAFAGFASAEETKVGTVNCEILNLREKPDTTSNILLKLQQGAQVTIISSSNGWSNVTYNKVTGWVSSEYISVKDNSIGTGVITGSVVNVRASASTTSGIVTTVEKGEKVSVYSRSDGWYKIKTSNGSVGWVSSEYLTLSSASRGTADQVQSAESDASDKTADTAGNEIIQYAKKFVGTAYVYGGSSPSGFDCSGFTQYVYKHFGYSLNRVASSQAGQGTSVKKADLQPGDLIFFTCRSKYIDHVGMYVGNGKFIHAASSRIGRVVVEDLSGYYSTHYAGARRILK